MIFKVFVDSSTGKSRLWHNESKDITVYPPGGLSTSGSDWIVYSPNKDKDTTPFTRERSIFTTLYGLVYFLGKYCQKPNEGIDFRYKVDNMDDPPFDESEIPWEVETQEVAVVDITRRRMNLT